MLKTLVKKQFLELGSFYFMNKKTGKLRSAGGVAAVILLFLFVFIVVAGNVLSFGMMLGMELFPKDAVTLYFALFGIVSVVFGVFGSVFRTYSLLYLSKDNSLLLSMPVKSGAILVSRLIAVLITSFVYCAVVWIPAIAVYFILTEASASSAVFALLLVFVITLFSAAVTCVLGFLVAKISVKLKNKSFITVIAALAFLALYYFVMFRFGSIMDSIINNAERFGEGIRKWAYPFHALGLAASGDAVAMLAVTAGTLVVTAAVVAVLAKTFLKIATTDNGVKKRAAKAEKVKSRSADAALFAKEIKRFVSSPTYMLNSGFGLVMMVVMAAAVVIKRADLIKAVGGMTESLGDKNIFAALITLAMFFVCSTACISAPSVSLEGKSIWIVQSLPVDPFRALRAKYLVNVVICSVPAIVCSVVMTVATGAGAFGTAAVILAVFAYICFISSFGLTLNVIFPNLNWTSEMVPIKQSLPVFIMIFGGIAVSVLTAIIWFFIHFFIDTRVFLLAVAVIYAAAAMLLRLWLRKSGARRFAAL